MTPMLSEKEDNSTELTLQQRYLRFIATWTGTATLGIAASGFTLLLNLIVLIWALATQPKQDGFVIIYMGSSTSCKHITLGIRLVINILSTIILVSSNRCTQYLCSPTRDAVNAHHSKGQWLDVGVRSYRNFKAIRGWKMVVVITLITTSMPIHLLYNSVALVTYAVQDYVAVTVDPSFNEDLTWKISNRLPNLNPSSTTLLDQAVMSLQHNVSHNTLQSVDLHDCTTVYRSSFQSKWGNLVVVSSELNTTEVNGTRHTTVAAVTEAWVASPGIVGNYQWYNASQYDGHTDNTLHPPTNTSLYTFADSCAINDAGSCSTKEYTMVGVESCFVQETTQRSTVSLSIGFIAFTMGSNLIKCLALLAVIKKDFRPLATTGEAIASFLKDPDIHTAGMGPVSVYDVSASRGATSLEWQAFAFNANRRLRLHRAATNTRWWIGTLSLLVPILTAGVCLYWGNAWRNIPYAGNTHSVYTGLDSFSTPAVYRVSNSYTGTALAVNAIQIGLAWSYIFVNDLMTSMVASKEYQSYATKRKAVRVARPEGQQRDTYFLSLPYRYAMPLVVVWTLLHWQISTELNLVKVQVYSINGILDTDRGYQGMVISSLWFTGIMSGSFLILVALIVISFLKYPRGMPLARVNSMLISAACHRGPTETEEASTRPVQYGVIPGAINDGHECVGFSSGKVEPLVAGRKYSSYVNVDIPTHQQGGKDRIEF